MGCQSIQFFKASTTSRSHETASATADGVDNAAVNDVHENSSTILPHDHSCSTVVAEEPQHSHTEDEPPSPAGNKDETTELIFIIDSNGRYLDYRRLWTLKGMEVIRCGTMLDV